MLVSNELAFLISEGRSVFCTAFPIAIQSLMLSRRRVDGVACDTRYQNIRVFKELLAEFCACITPSFENSQQMRHANLRQISHIRSAKKMASASDLYNTKANVSFLSHSNRKWNGPFWSHLSSKWDLRK
jgi:hypothetical protein